MCVCVCVCVCMYVCVCLKIIKDTFSQADPDEVIPEELERLVRRKSDETSNKGIDDSSDSLTSSSSNLLVDTHAEELVRLKQVGSLHTYRV